MSNQSNYPVFDRNVMNSFRAVSSETIQEEMDVLYLRARDVDRTRAERCAWSWAGRS